MDIASLRVHSPSHPMLVCGGFIETDYSLPSKSLRCVFLRKLDSPKIKKYEIIIAEDFTRSLPTDLNNDFLTFEKYLGAISSIVILFSESYGSVAELGAFSTIDELASRLLVFIDDKNYAISSFIKLGILKSIENAHHNSAISVLNCKDLNIEKIENIKNLKEDTFHELIAQSIEERAKNIKQHSTFNKENIGHVIILIVGIIQHYSALTIYEIELHLEQLGIKLDEMKLKTYLYCAKYVEWITTERNLSHTYYIIQSNNKAISFKTIFSDTNLDRDRWQLDILGHWKKHDPSRFRCIQRVRRLGP